MGYLAHWYLEAMRQSRYVVDRRSALSAPRLFGVRFLIQWLSSERKGHSVIPVAFWYFSLIGGAISLFYALHLHAWPLILRPGRAAADLCAQSLDDLSRPRRGTA